MAEHYNDTVPSFAHKAGQRPDYMADTSGQFVTSGKHKRNAGIEAKNLIEICFINQ